MGRRRFSLHAGAPEEPTVHELSEQYGVSALDWRRTKDIISRHRFGLVRDTALILAAHALLLLVVAVTVFFVLVSALVAAIATSTVGSALSLSLGVALSRYWATVAPRRRAGVCGILTRTMFGRKGLAVVYRHAVTGAESGFFLVPWADDTPEPVLPGASVKRRTILHSRHSRSPFSSAHSSRSGRQLSAQRLSLLIRTSSAREAGSVHSAYSSYSTLGAAPAPASAASACPSIAPEAAPAVTAAPPMRLLPRIPIGSISRASVPPLVPPLALHGPVNVDALSSLPADSHQVCAAIDKLPQLAAEAASAEPRARLDAIRTISRLLARELDPPIQPALSAGALAPLVAALAAYCPPPAAAAPQGERRQPGRGAAENGGRADAPPEHGPDAPNAGAGPLQAEAAFEAAWALTNIASGSSADALALLDAGCLPHLLRLAGAAEERMSEQAVWALGNLAGDCAQSRDAVLAEGGAEALALLLTSNGMGTSLLRTVAWAACNLLRTEPRPPLASVRPLLGGFGAVLQGRCADDDTLLQALWAAIYLADCPSPSAPTLDLRLGLLGDVAGADGLGGRGPGERASASSGGGAGGAGGGERGAGRGGEEEAGSEACGAVAAALSDRGLRRAAELTAHRALPVCRPAIRLLAKLVGGGGEAESAAVVGSGALPRLVACLGAAADWRVAKVPRAICPCALPP